MAEAVGGGIDATVSRGALQVVVAVEFRFRAVAIIPLLVTVGTRCIAGESVAARVAGVVAVGLQQKQALLTCRGAPSTPRITGVALCPRLRTLYAQ